MTYQPTAIPDDLRSLPLPPAWITPAGSETSGIVAFRSGATLMVLDQLIGDSRYGVPLKLLANRLALSAAMATSKLEGRLAREEDIRDAYHLTPPGEARGPDGDLLAYWRDAVRLRTDGVAGFADLIGPVLAGEVVGWLDAGQARVWTHGPLAGCVSVMRAVLKADDRAERIACLLSDLVLARALNWKVVLPVTAQRITKTMLCEVVAGKPKAELAVQSQILESIEETIRLTRDVARRAEALRSVAPKLRAKGSDAAVNLFLAEDAVAPAPMLSPRIQGTSTAMTDRAARRFCDRLVDLGVARELTGRSTFRLYGITP
ncbi:DUF1403 family protein [Roseovarius pelagicus]|uniref:DUF1403 family protein n=1 Tax=Roseovarius pelagicus TaxID=2980108 RepID=A0ABY6D5W7_9RHOB|nr:DUF1403 family protein [Roseovarius pelagicus]UXX81539.1 DUF1403 family protein [Roseovarius pelagicus]